MALAPISDPAGNRLRSVGRSAVWFLLAVLCAAPVPAFYAVPVPVSISIGLATLSALTFWRTVDALLLLAALVPISGALHIVSGAPYDSFALLEVYVLVVLGAAATRAAVRSTRLTASPFDLAVVGFICLALASCAAQFPMALLRAGFTGWTDALSGLVFHDYFLRPPPFLVVERTAVLVEGAALAVLVARVFRARSAQLRLSSMIVAGGAAAAALNVQRLFEIALRRPPFFDSFLDALRSVRFNTLYGDLNAAGSYFAMVAILAASHAGFRSRSGALHAAVLPLLVCGLWISGSRVALVAALLGAIVAIALRTPGARLRRLESRTSLLVAACVLLFAFTFLIYLLPVTRHGTFRYSVSTRVELLKIGGRMLADRPVLGVGTSQYYARFPEYVSPELERAFAEATGRPVPRENAHNQFVQILAELGIAGLTALVLILVLALQRGQTVDPWRTGVVVALTGFLLTSLAGHPLLTPVVAFSFWVVTGLSAIGGTQVSERSRRTLAGGLIATALLLLLTMPWRWSVERREADLAGVSLGLSLWQRDSVGTRFQTAEGRATVFVSSTSRLVRIPIRSGAQRTSRVQVFLDGRLASAIVAMPDRWIDMTLSLPRGRDTPAYRRIDLVVESSPVAAEGNAAAVLMVGRVLEQEP